MQAVELQSGSLQALLDSGELALIEDLELRSLLALWPADVTDLKNMSQLLVVNREEIIRFLHDKLPTLDIARSTGQMDRYPQSSYSGDPHALQKNMVTEGLFGNRGMLVEDTDAAVRTLTQRADEILALLQPGRDRE